MKREVRKRKHGDRRTGGLTLKGTVAALWALARRGRKAIEARVKRHRAKSLDAVTTVTTPAQGQQVVQVVADEKTIRGVAESQAGGISSKESAERYARGENPGGLHHKAVRELALEDEEEAGFQAEHDVAERRERRPGHARAMPIHRKGA